MSFASPARAPLVGVREIDYPCLLPAKAPNMMTETLPDLVARSALMRGTSKVALAQLGRARLQLRTLAPGECVFRPGDSVDAIYLLLDARAAGERA